MSSEVQSPLDAKPSIGGVIKNGAIAGLVGLVINVILYLIGSAMGAFPETLLTPFGQPITLTAIIGATVMGAVLGTIAYLLLSRFLVKPLANRWFIILAVIVLVVYAIMPFVQLPGASTLEIFLLQAMHLAIGLPLIYFLPKSE